jgi:hypothetical protein
MKNDESIDFDFRHHLYDTIILLGGKKEIADLLKRSMDYGITEEDITAVRNYNLDLIDQTKEKLTQINKTKIRVSHD